MGGAVFAPTALGVLKGCRATPRLDWEPEFFSNSQAALVTSIADVILPADDTPGAKDLGVPAFIEDMVHQVYDEDTETKFLDGLDAFDEQAKEEYGNSFVDCSSEQQVEFAEEQNNLLNSEETGDSEQIDFFRTMKELTILGYFTSEVGATEVLRYESVPGSYEGCVPFEEIGKTWAV